MTEEQNQFILGMQYLVDQGKLDKDTPVDKVKFLLLTLLQQESTTEQINEWMSGTFKNSVELPKDRLEFVWHGNDLYAICKDGNISMSAKIPKDNTMLSAILGSVDSLCDYKKFSDDYKELCSRNKKLKKHTPSMKELWSEYVQTHSKRAESIEYHLNGDNSRKTAKFVPGRQVSNKIACSFDLTWMDDTEYAWEQPEIKEKDIKAFEFMVKFFEQIENGDILLYALSRIQERRQIPVQLLLGKSNAGKSVIIKLASHIKLHRAEEGFFGETKFVENLGNTSIITAEETSKIRHPRMDINSLKSLVTGNEIIKEGKGDKAIKIIGHVYLMISDNWAESSHIRKILCTKSGDGEAIRRRFSTYAFTEENQKWLADRVLEIREAMDWLCPNYNDGQLAPAAARFFYWIRSTNHPLWVSGKGKSIENGATGISPVNTLNADYQLDAEQSGHKKALLEVLVEKCLYNHKGVHSAYIITGKKKDTLEMWFNTKYLYDEWSESLKGTNYRPSGGKTSVFSILKEINYSFTKINKRFKKATYDSCWTLVLPLEKLKQVICFDSDLVEILEKSITQYHEYEKELENLEAMNEFERDLVAKTFSPDSIT